LADVLINGYSLNFPLLIVGWRKMLVVEINTNDLVHI
jgi:hypothetical protein